MVYRKTLFLSTFCCIASISLNNISCAPEQYARIALESSAFENNKPIPQKYTCEGKNYSPPLSWKRVPQKAKSLVLICDDPDAPHGTFVHWFIYNIPASVTNLPENIKEGEDVPQIPAKQSDNDFGKHGWSGPMPPHGTHRYVFKIYALNVSDLRNLPEKERDKSNFFYTYSNNIIGYGELTGLYTKAGEKPEFPRATAKKEEPQAQAVRKQPQPFQKKQGDVNTCGY
jgi:Raf kinase inhibitor-like YbhB/YbcL family protein